MASITVTFNVVSFLTCSLFHVHCSLLIVPCSLFHVHCCVFILPRSFFHVHSDYDSDQQSTSLHSEQAHKYSGTPSRYRSVIVSVHTLVAHTSAGLLPAITATRFILNSPLEKSGWGRFVNVRFTPRQGAPDCA